jgi:hypothetical protein
LLYGFSVICLLFFVGVIWVAKESLDKFVAQHQGDAWLIVDDSGVGGESKGNRFQFPWEGFRRIVARSDMWLLETRQGGWMVLPTGSFTVRALELFRQRARKATRR